MTRFVFFALAVVFLASPATAGGCDYFCKDGAATASPAPSTARAIINPSRQRLGDVYNPGHGRRVQIRDTSRRIIGYIERDGTVTNTHRQKVGTLDW